jgi:hypothetical protein
LSLGADLPQKETRVFCCKTMWSENKGGKTRKSLFESQEIINKKSKKQILLINCNWININ